MSSKGAFDEGPPMRRVYDKKDIIVQAMLKSGLEELITNGFYMEQVNEKKDLKPMPVLKKEPEIIDLQLSSQEAKFKRILAELYEMEEGLKKTKNNTRTNTKI